MDMEPEGGQARAVPVAGDPEGERGLYRPRLGRGDFALGAGVRVVGHHWRLLDRSIFVPREMRGRKNRTYRS